MPHAKVSRLIHWTRPRSPRPLLSTLRSSTLSSLEGSQQTTGLYLPMYSLWNKLMRSVLYHALYFIVQGTSYAKIPHQRKQSWRSSNTSITLRPKGMNRVSGSGSGSFVVLTLGLTLRNGGGSGSIFKLHHWLVFVAATADWCVHSLISKDSISGVGSLPYAGLSLLKAIYLRNLRNLKVIQTTKVCYPK